MKCPFFTQCGGCSLQHIPYELQLENKKKQIQLLFGQEDVDVLSDSPFFYRNRMDFIFHAKGVGLRKKNNPRGIVDISECTISETRLNELLVELRTHFTDNDYFDAKKKQGTFKLAIIRTGDTSCISFVLNKDSSRVSQACEKIEDFAKKSSVENVVVTYVGRLEQQNYSDEFYVVKGSDFLEQKYGDSTFKFSCQAFFQNNHEMALKLHALVRSRLQPTDQLIDLYGGVGTFGIMNADLFKEVTVIEYSSQAIDAAKQNVVLNTLSNVNAFVGDATSLAKHTLSNSLTIITDPPRSGMTPKAIQLLNGSGAKRIIYISCNPKQLAKEITFFSQYELKYIALCDLFPQTPHMEVVVELCKRS